MGLDCFCLSLLAGIWQPIDLSLYASGTILGFKPDQAKDSVSGNARLAVIRGHAARQTYRGVISMPEVVEVGSTSNTSKSASGTLPGLPDEAASASKQGIIGGSKRKRDSEVEDGKRKKV